MSAFVARWCVGSRVEATGGVFQVRGDEPAPIRVENSLIAPISFPVTLPKFPVPM